MIKCAALFLGLCFYASGMAGNDNPQASVNPTSPASTVSIEEKKEDIRAVQVIRNGLAFIAGFGFLPAALLSCVITESSFVGIPIAAVFSALCMEKSHKFHLWAESKAKK